MVFSQYYLESNRYVADRLLKKVDHVASAMMESGLNKFYKEIVTFNQHLMDRDSLNQNENINFAALNIKQFQRNLCLFLCYIVISLLIFCVEVIVCKLFRWNCRQYSKRRVHPFVQSHPIRPRPRQRSFSI